MRAKSIIESRLEIYIWKVSRMASGAEVTYSLTNAASGTSGPTTYLALESLLSIQFYLVVTLHFN